MQATLNFLSIYARLGASTTQSVIGTCPEAEFILQVRVFLWNANHEEKLIETRNGGRESKPCQHHGKNLHHSYLFGGRAIVW